MKIRNKKIYFILIPAFCFLMLLSPISRGVSVKGMTRKTPTNYSYTLPAKDKFFITKEIGWKATYDPQGMFKEDMTLYKTTNGGKSWIKIADTNKLKTIPFTGDKTGMSFINKSKGWITAYAPWEGKFGFYTTNNGGSTWHDEKLITPSKFKHSEIYAYAPLIISPSDALLVAFPLGNDNKPHLLIYITHNGGKTWTPYADKTNGGSKGISWKTLDDTLKKLKVDYKRNEWNFDGQKWSKAV